MSAHQEIINALAAGDDETFCRVVEEHLVATNRRILSRDLDDDVPDTAPRRIAASG